MKLGIVITHTDPETVFNALRLGNFALSQGDTVKVFLLGKGVETESIEDAKFAVQEQLAAFVKDGGGVLACGTCLKLRNSSGSDVCPISTMKDLYDLISSSDKVLTF